ncbi:cellulose binding domain-containing protein [Actinoplanes xinjiangensis]|uniref:cellulose binding domain-containing protein n=1 Tax=Actinoplanes xinjiangensis TaxID=512350 RepID=UPI00343087EA
MSLPPDHEEAPARGRRSPADVVRDAAWRLATAMLTAPSPEPRVRTARAPGERSAAGRFVLVVGGLAAVAVTMLLVVLVVTRPYQQSARPEQAAGLPERPAAAPSPSAPASPTPATTSRAAGSPSPPSRAAVSSVSPPASPPAAASAVAVAVPLAATYRTTPYVAGLLGYRTEVTVANPDTAARDGWTLTVTLPRSTLWINQVEGATVTRQDAVWTFVPDESTTAIPPGGQVGISFEVHGATLLDAAPADCRIDGAPCTS